MADFSTPPQFTEYVIARPEDLARVNAGYESNHPLVVRSLQAALNDVSSKNLIEEDGVFGDATFEKLKLYQRNRGLLADGIAGFKTQRRLCAGFLEKAALDSHVVAGLSDGVVVAESGFNFGAVNWSKPGGVDCGVIQRRVYDPYTESALVSAFDARRQIGLVVDRLEELHGIYAPRAGCTTASTQAPLAYIPISQRSWRLAALCHNYPYAADAFSRSTTWPSTYWNKSQDWVVEAHYKFTDGADVTTPFEWCQFLAFGAPDHGHEGVYARLVVDWTHSGVIPEPTHRLRLVDGIPQPTEDPFLPVAV